MNSTSKSICGLMAAGFLWLIPSAHAGTVDVEYQGLKGGSISTNLGGGGAGAFKWKMISGTSLPYAVGSTFLSFCIEIQQNIKTSGISTYDVVMPANAPNDGFTNMGAAKADLMAHWFGKYFKGNSWSNWTTDEAKAFQMGVWEIVYENLSNIGNVTNTSHAFYITGSSTAKTLAQSWFNDATWKTGNKLALKAMSSPHGNATGKYQDQIVVVPLPLAAYSALPILGALVFRSRRRHA